MTRTTRTSVAPPAPAADRPATQEELIDEALVETFPASDPISPGAGVSSDPTVRTDDERGASRAPTDRPAK